MRAVTYGDRDFYAVLEVAPLASTEVIQAAHRTLIKHYHPDLAVGDQAREAAYTERTKDLNEARQILADPRLRKEYDRQRAAGPKPAEPTPQPAASRTRPRTQGATSTRTAAARGKARAASPAAAVASGASAFEAWLARAIQGVGTGIASWVLLWLCGWGAWKLLEAFLATFAG